MLEICRSHCHRSSGESYNAPYTVYSTAKLCSFDSGGRHSFVAPMSSRKLSVRGQNLVTRKWGRFIKLRRGSWSQRSSQKGRPLDLNHPQNERSLCKVVPKKRTALDPPNDVQSKRPPPPTSTSTLYLHFTPTSGWMCSHKNSRDNIITLFFTDQLFYSDWYFSTNYSRFFHFLHTRERPEKKQDENWENRILGGFRDILCLNVGWAGGKHM